MKDFSTWGGTVLAAALLGEIGPADTKTETARRVNIIVRVVAHELGNTPSVCRSCYVHPLVLERYADGTLPEARSRRPANVRAFAKRRPRCSSSSSRLVPNG